MPVTVTVSTSDPLKPCSACRSCTALTGHARWRDADNAKFLADPVGRLGLVPFRAEDLEEPELAVEHGTRPRETVGSQARGEHPRLRGPP